MVTLLERVSDCASVNHRLLPPIQPPSKAEELEAVAGKKTISW